ncbi:hypothetical protein [Chryseobacterium sp. A321]
MKPAYKMKAVYSNANLDSLGKPWLAWLFQRLFSAVLILSLCLEPARLKAQATYIDPTTTAALFVYSDALESAQNKLLQEKRNLRSAQMVVAGQLAVVGEIQNTILLGLSEVSGTLQNGIQVKTLLEELSQCAAQARSIEQFVQSSPQYAVFGVKASSQTYASILEMSSDLTELLRSGNLNLASAGDRYRLLYSVSEKVRSLKLWLMSISIHMERAKRVGFLRSLEPFAGYIRADKAIVSSVLTRYKSEF